MSGILGPTKTIDIVSPVFREEVTIGAFHVALIAAIEPLKESYAFRFIYVVDPAGDGTERALDELVKRDGRIVVHVMSRRFGHQAALVAGMDESTGDAVIMLDSDLQHPPSHIVEMVRRWEQGADIVQMLRRDGRTIGRAKRTTSRWFYRFLERISDVRIQPGAADYRLLSRPVVDVFRQQIQEHNPFLRGLVAWVGYTVVYLPFEPDRRYGGQSSYGVAQLLSFAVNGFCSFSKLPLRLCIVLGFLSSLLTLIGGIAYTLFYFFDDARSVPGWASLFVLLSATTSLNLLFLGILGEYLSLVFDEVKGRPRYLIGRSYGDVRQPETPHRTDSARAAQDAPRGSHRGMSPS